MNLKQYLKHEKAPRPILKAYETLSSYVHTFDHSGQYKWDIELPSRIKGDKKLEKAFKLLYDYLYPDGMPTVSLRASCDCHEHDDPHEGDCGLGWYDSACVWHWFM